MFHERWQPLEVAPEGVELASRTIHRDPLFDIDPAAARQRRPRIVIVAGCIDPGGGVHGTMTGRAAVYQCAACGGNRRTGRRSILELLQAIRCQRRATQRGGPALDAGHIHCGSHLFSPLLTSVSSTVPCGTLAQSRTHEHHDSAGTITANARVMEFRRAGHRHHDRVRNFPIAGRHRTPGCESACHAGALGGRWGRHALRRVVPRGDSRCAS